MSDDLDEVLTEARECAARDHERAMELFRRVAAGEVGPAWGEAQMELAHLAWNAWDLAQVVERTSAVVAVDAALLLPTARAHAALLLNQARDHQEVDVDEAQVRWARAALEAADEHYAAAGASSLLASLAARRGDREGARRELDRAETRYVAAGSMYGLPSCEHTRARLCMEEGDDAGAREHVRRAQSLIAQLPQGFENVKAWRRRLEKLEGELASRRGAKP